MTGAVPQNLEAEEALLGAMIISSRAIEAANDVGIRSRHFYRPSHRLIHDAIVECAEKGSVDELTVWTHLRTTGQGDKAGGQVAVVGLTGQVPAVSNARAYAEEVYAQYLRRSIWNAATGIHDAVESANRPAEELVEYAVQEIDAVASEASRRGRSSLATSTELSDWVFTHLDEPSTTIERFPYPLPTLQQHSGGFARGELVTVGGYSGDGKSVFALQMLEHCAMNNARVGYWSLEMPPHQVELRLISMLTAIPVLKLKQPWELDMEQKQAAKDAADRLRKLDFSVYGGGTTTSRIVSEQRRKKYDLIVVDHLHRMPGSEDPKTLPSLVTPLKDVALETDCGVVNLCQLNRDADRGFPTPNSNRLKGGNVLVDESDALMFVYRERDSFQMPLARGSLIVAKMRDGLSGYSIPVRLDTDRLRFVERVA